MKYTPLARWLLCACAAASIVAGCDKKTAVPDDQPEETGVETPSASGADQPDSGGGDELSYQQMQRQYDQLAEQYARESGQLSADEKSFGMGMRQMGRQMGYMHRQHPGWAPGMHQGRGRHGMNGRHGMKGRHGQGMMGRHGMMGRQNDAQPGACAPHSQCWASGVDSWHRQMAQMHRQMAARARERGLDDLAERHRQMAQRHQAFAEQLPADSDGESNQGEPNAGESNAEEQAGQGKQLYAQACAACHGANGAGVSGAFPPLDGSEYVTGDKARLVGIVLQGHSGPIEVGGETYNGVMPPFAGRFSDAQLAGLLTYVRRAWSNSASPISADDVEHMREDDD